MVAHFCPDIQDRLCQYVTCDFFISTCKINMIVPNLSVVHVNVIISHVDKLMLLVDIIYLAYIGGSSMTL